MERPVFGSDGSFGERLCVCVCTVSAERQGLLPERHNLVLVLVPEVALAVPLLRFRRFRFPVPVQFLRHPAARDKAAITGILDM